MPRYSQFGDPVRQKLAGHLILSVWGSRLLEVQSCEIKIDYLKLNDWNMQQLYFFCSD